MERQKEFFYRPLSEVFKNRRVSFDMDGVLSFTVYPVVEKVNEDFGTDFSINDFYGWATVKTWAQENWDRRNEFVDTVAKTPEEYDMWVWTNANILLNGVMGSHSDIVTRCAVGAADHARVVTSRIPALRWSTFRWHEMFLPWIDRGNISINSDSDLPGEVFKYREINRHGIDLHFEDSLRHAKLIVENTPAQVVLLANWDVSKNDAYWHPRILQITRPNHRLVTMRDVHKTLVFQNKFK
jgi:uncharacterized HAD superfamily protein